MERALPGRKEEKEDLRSSVNMVSVTRRVNGGRGETGHDEDKDVGK